MAHTSGLDSDHPYLEETAVTACLANTPTTTRLPAGLFFFEDFLMNKTLDSLIYFTEFSDDDRRMLQEASEHM